MIYLKKILDNLSRKNELNEKIETILKENDEL